MARASVITVGHLAAYDTFKDAFVNYMGFARTSPVTHFGAAISAATFSSIISNPLDVVKVRVIDFFSNLCMTEYLSNLISLFNEYYIFNILKRRAP